MQIQPKGTTRERVDFSKIKTSVPIPNLIEVQKKSYERFLQMDLLPDERDDTGLQSVFKSVFPISDFRGLSELAFVDYSIGNWECKCGSLKGLNHLRTVAATRTADLPYAPIHFILAMFYAKSAERSTRTSSPSATVAAILSACN